MGNNTQAGFKSIFVGWLARGAALAVIGVIIVVVAIAMGGKVTGLNVGPVQVSLAPQTEPNAANSVTALNTQNSNPQAQAVQVQSVANTGNNLGSCPYDPNGFWLAASDTWFYEPGYTGAEIMYAYDGFAVWEPNFYGWGVGEIIVFPTTSVPQNTWLPLEGTGFQICVDSSSAVYAKYQV